jgi:hypothetical protein
MLVIQLKQKMTYSLNASVMQVRGTSDAIAFCFTSYSWVVLNIRIKSFKIVQYATPSSEPASSS